jgi:hypothetical protein
MNYTQKIMRVRPAIVAENTELVSNVTGYGKQGYAISQI